MFHILSTQIRLSHFFNPASYYRGFWEQIQNRINWKLLLRWLIYFHCILVDLFRFLPQSVRTKELKETRNAQTTDYDQRTLSTGDNDLTCSLRVQSGSCLSFWSFNMVISMYKLRNSRMRILNLLAFWILPLLGSTIPANNFFCAS